MKTINGILSDVQGNKLGGMLVTCTLMPTTGWRVASPKEQFSDVLFETATTTSGTGAYSFTLMENDLMEPSGTYYQLGFPDSASEVNIRVLSSTPSPSNVKDVLIPGSLPPVGNVGNFVTYPAGDARYAFKGQVPGSAPGIPLISADANNTTTTGTDGGIYTPRNPNVAWGRIASISSPSSQTGIGVETDITGLTIPFTVLTTRICRYDMAVSVVKRVQAGYVSLRLCNQANGVVAYVTELIQPEEEHFFMWSCWAQVNDPKVRLLSSSGTVDTVSISGKRCTLVISDAGPLAAVYP